MRLHRPHQALTVIGTGYMGLTHAICMAELGHDVLALDIDACKASKAARGMAPFHEPRIEWLLRKHLKTSRLRFTTSYNEAANYSDVHFLCVGTPQGPDGCPDLSQLHAAVDALAPVLSDHSLIIGKSTVPVGTGRCLERRINERTGGLVEVAWNPEFLREGRAVEDSLSPDRLVFGVTSARSADRLRRLYAKLLAKGIPVFLMDLETAELAKLSANAILAAKISFINAIGEICESAGADVLSVAKTLGADHRIGKHFLSPGLGYGGSCLPKDVRALQLVADKFDTKSLSAILGEVDLINTRCRSRIVGLARTLVGGSLEGCVVGVLGVAFKPGCDDVRGSASLDVCSRLVAEGAIVTAHDPLAMWNAAEVHPYLHFADSALNAAKGARMVMHLTEWEEYRVLDPAELGSVVAERNIIDARSVLDEERWRSAGWSFAMLGRKPCAESRALLEGQPSDQQC